MCNCHLHLDNRQEIRAPYSRRSADTSTAPRPTRLTGVPWRGVALVHRILLGLDRVGGQVDAVEDSRL